MDFLPCDDLMLDQYRKLALQIKRSLGSHRAHVDIIQAGL